MRSTRTGSRGSTLGSSAMATHDVSRLATECRRRFPRSSDRCLELATAGEIQFQIFDGLARPQRRNRPRRLPRAASRHLRCFLPRAVRVRPRTMRVPPSGRRRSAASTGDPASRSGKSRRRVRRAPCPNGTSTTTGSRVAARIAFRAPARPDHRDRSGPRRRDRPGPPA